MRILHTEASCGWGGQEIRILEEARGLIERGHAVSLVCPAEARILAEAPRFGVPAQALPIGRKRLPGLFALRRHLAQHRVDVVNTHSSTDAWLAALACATMPAPPAIVRTRHISAPVKVSASSRWLYGRSPAHLVTTGEALRQTLVTELGLDPARVTSVPTGIDPARFFPAEDPPAAKAAVGLDPVQHHLGIVATLRSWKGHLYLIDAFKALNRADWTLVIVGEGPMADPIRARVAELGLTDRVVFAGQVTDPERWLRALDVFCLPSYANEGVPQALMQAMFTALPIVSTPVGAILEAVEDGRSALIVPPQDAPALQVALARLIDDRAQSMRLGDAARQRALARFTLAAMVDRMQAIFGAAAPGGV